MEQHKKRGPKPLLGRPMTAAERKKRQLTKRRLLMAAAKSQSYTPTNALISNPHIEALQRLEAYQDHPTNERLNLLIEKAVIRLLQHESTTPVPTNSSLEAIYREARQTFAEFQEQQRANA